MTKLQDSLTLPNGTVLANRIAKSAMSENLSNVTHEPTAVLINSYKEWAKSGAGLLITGNVMIDNKALGEPMNVVVEDHRHFKKLQEWAATVKGTDTHLWVQINHPGRQAMDQINSVLKAPSAIPLKSKSRKKATTKIPKALTDLEIQDIIKQFGNTAKILKEAGFNGVQIHGAHGYLVSQFLSPYTNVRKDEWGGTFEKRARFVLEIYKEIRAQVGPDFPIGIKLNSADFQKGGFSEEDSMKVIELLSEAGIDLIEISGGTYEAPAMMMGNRKQSTKEREAYFIDYIEKARKVTKTPLMLTGGFRTVSVMQNAIASEKLDIVGLARPFCLFPNIANEILTESRDTFPTDINKSGVKSIDGMMNIIWYEAQIKRLGLGKLPKLKLSAWSVFFNYLFLILKFKLTKK
ncbi:2,4-dienoyl-CoA reductase-like NADH-dependent reductase (Old Yellow Enzyme family) [Tenacibaculum skagerrakense]|uniref:2,4-dienoyl-CoA reductase-like NADH-dependent reductase (Old Yellow Enzyme family) n=1 Tax=Tenacibaculum skagerrakense TaxID=186571 RepID=A0A4R2NVE6_9FLAO|nr:NADH:flavin oxidoreductase/NADH oxidase family protein [Tenacibaculum skagerrakense]TCP25952.1 2,4-dienoyl-CoA reductase-like NADH-dependent reductase (Old Yellow Enzyme family) [Tenacibaculum skagerrakense]